MNEILDCRYPFASPGLARLGWFGPRYGVGGGVWLVLASFRWAWLACLRLGAVCERTGSRHLVLGLRVS